MTSHAHTATARGAAAASTTHDVSATTPRTARAAARSSSGPQVTTRRAAASRGDTRVHSTWGGSKGSPRPSPGVPSPPVPATAAACHARRTGRPPRGSLPAVLDAGLVGSPASAVRRARAAVAGLFLVNGALFAGVVPRYPEITAHLGLSNAAF